MNIEVLFFSSIRELLGMSRMVMASSAKTVGELRDELASRGGPWADALGRTQAVRASLDQSIVAETAALTPGCEVAFFPPVTGG